MSSEPLWVELAVLRTALEVLLTHVEGAVGRATAIDHDYFWSIPPDELYDMDRPPTGLTIGQLSECLDHLRRIADDPENAIGYSLVWAAEVLRAIGTAAAG